MNINNSKQIPFMRWRDFKNFEKFTFIHGHFALENNETYENASQIDDFKLLIEIMHINNKTRNYSPIILYDNETSNVYIGYSDDGFIVDLVSSLNEGIAFANIQYFSDTDQLKIQSGAEDFLTTDNIKTIFNQSLVGTGNITLFRHKLELAYNTTSGSPGEVYLDWLSTSNLNVDSLQDLQTLLKVSRNDTTDSNYLGYNSYSTFGITFSHSTGVFKIEDEYDTYNVTGVSDKVTTL